MLTECLAMAEGKTGALLGAACHLGALVGGADACTATRYREFGRNLGVVFRLVDDLLGIWGYPGPVARRLTELYGREKPPDEFDLADLIEQAGGKAWAETEAHRRAQVGLQATAPEATAAGDLKVLAEIIARRDR